MLRMVLKIMEKVTMMEMIECVSKDLYRSKGLGEVNDAWLRGVKELANKNDMFSLCEIICSYIDEDGPIVSVNQLERDLKNIEKEVSCQK